MISKNLEYTEKQIKAALKRQAVADKDSAVPKIDNFIVKQVFESINWVIKNTKNLLIK